MTIHERLLSRFLRTGVKYNLFNAWRPDENGCVSLGIDHEAPGEPIERVSVLENELLYPGEFGYHGHQVRRRAASENARSYAVAQVPKGRVFGYNGLCFTHEQKLLSEASRRCVRASYGWPPLPVFRPKKPIKIQGRWAVLLSDSATNYYHWIFDVIPKLRLFRASNLKIDGWLVPPMSLPFVSEWLELLDVPKSCCVEVHARGYFEAEELVVGGCSRSLEAPDGWVIDYLSSLRTIASSRAVCSGDERKTKIYISRRNSRCRRIVNETQLQERLKKSGFQTVELEHCSVSQQVNIFAHADKIIAPHGAGLANIVFSMPGASVFEIFGERHQVTCFEKIANLLNFEYSKRVVASLDGLGRNSSPSDIFLKESDFEAIEAWLGGDGNIASS